MSNQTYRRLSYGLRRASRESGAPMWARLARLARRPTRARRVVNLKRISAMTSDGDVVVVPGKVLGTGGIGHRITLCPFSISRAAAGKVRGAGGSLASLEELAASHPNGTGVRLLG